MAHSNKGKSQNRLFLMGIYHYFLTATVNGYHVQQGQKAYQNACCRDEDFLTYFIFYMRKYILYAICI